MKVLTSAPAFILLATLFNSNAHASTTPRRTAEGIPSHQIRLVCFELQRLQLSGSGCDLGSDEVLTTPPKGSLPALTPTQLKNVCPLLCNNGLGTVACGCSDVTPEDPIMDLDSICDGFCAESVPVAGCNCRLAMPRLQLDQLPKENTTEIAETTTEPDWASVCVQLCAMGDGGALCNCDKPPFV